jgi:hypothetical protein
VEPSLVHGSGLMVHGVFGYQEFENERINYGSWFMVNGEMWFMVNG